ncbi:MAG TPA: DUF3307 domain-containing protein [Patescibacteria group bacterium]|nr:DUF3307 domain-containing protein [Patescibacteria group bacterium]
MLTAEVFFMLIVGHCIGDFLLQPAVLAKNKKKNTLYGWSTCTTHCMIYALTVGAAIAWAGYKPTILQIFLIFLTHFVIDKTLLLDVYFKIMKIRSWDVAIPNPHSYSLITVKQAVDVSFGAIVYVVADNTLHLLSMYCILKFL